MFAVTQRQLNSDRVFPPPYFAFNLSDPGNFLSPVIMVLGAHTKQFKDSNFNVLKASFLGISSLLEAAHAAGGAKGNRAALSTVVTPAVDKLGDRKLQVNSASWSVTCRPFKPTGLPFSYRKRNLMYISIVGICLFLFRPVNTRSPALECLLFYSDRRPPLHC